MAEQWRVIGVNDPPSGSYTHLAPIADDLGVPWKGAVELAVRINGLHVTLGLDIDSGSVCGLIIDLIFEGAEARPRSPSIELRKETASDRKGKERGINREVQTGDTAFDEQVYIDGTPTDDEVLRVLGRPQTRRAVLQLLDSGGAKVVLTPHGITVTWRGSRASIFEPGEARAALQALLVIARGGGPGGPSTERHGWWLPAVCAIALVGAMPYLLVLLANDRVDWRLPVGGLIVGPLLVIAARPLLARIVSGDSGSLHRLNLSFYSLLFASTMLGPAFPVHLNAALDTSRPVLVRGTVTHVGPLDDESNVHTVTIRWDDATETEHELSPPIHPGDPMAQLRHAGAFGFAWSNRPYHTAPPAP